MRKHIFASLAVLGLGIAVFAAFTGLVKPPAQSEISLSDARKDRDAQVPKQFALGSPAPQPPAEKFKIVHYPSKLGQFAAYLWTPSATEGQPKKYPAIVWIKGSDHNSLGDVWSTESGAIDEFDAFRAAGIVMLFPSLRGGNDNPGYYEHFYGEVDDILAAADYLAQQEFVDPNRIYLGGHSTGGTLALLTAEYSGRFRATFSLAPVSDVRGYGADFKSLLEKGDTRGFELRSPVYWLKWITSPVYVFEGDRSPSNIGDLRRLARVPRNPLTHFYIVNDADHVTSVHAVTSLLAAKISADTGAQSTISFDAKELSPL
jgi:acetyl esterase/lipase